MVPPYYVVFIVWIVVSAIAIPPMAYICWKTFVRAGPDAAAARRWILWFKIALPLFLISAIWSTIQQSINLGAVGGFFQLGIAWTFCDLVGTTASLAMSLSLVEAAYWLASVRNNGLPVRNSGWSRILAYVVTAILFCLTIVLLGLYMNRYFSSTYYDEFKFYNTITIIGLTWQSTMAAISIALVGISIALLVKTRRDAVHLSSAAKLYLIATVLFMFPFVWNFISIGIRFAIISNDHYSTFTSINWLGVVSSIISWGCHVACFYMQLRLRKLKIGVEDATKQRSTSV
ncbi:hypothetical protein F5X68DRAFT_211458 [Plectosphaerella plurivora]|uniref:Uncharacterized protein n=1 Tax=Plectosphaerella plurivora TaxID=936078 RepID=A0A9P8V7U7_9PEZI|nr:hypothetical protein F5X68DRAFT_211458 [Plectosphaerella plurivora]